MDILKILKYLNKKQWMYVGLAIVFIVLLVYLDLKLPDYMSAITTLVETEGSTMPQILEQGAYMLLCALGSMIASIIVGWFAAQVAAGLSRTLREKVYNKTMDFSLAEINRFSSSSLINRTTNDITQIQNLVSMGLQAIIKAPILAIWAILKISGKSWQWTTATLVAVIILVVMLTLTLIFAVPRFSRIQKLTDNLNRVTREQLTGIRVVRAFNGEKYQEDKFTNANEDLTVNNLVANRIRAIMSPTMTLINSGLTLAVYWIGAVMINTAAVDMKLGIFSDMVVFSNYAMQVIMAFMMLNMIFILLPRASVSAKRVNEVLDVDISVKDGAGSNPSEKGTLEFKNVSFHYPDGRDDTLKNISFRAEKGTTTAFIGSTGSGKSTLLSLIPRLFDCTKGEILVDGVNVKDYTLKELRNKIGYISQKATLFSGTVTSNVSYGDSGKDPVSHDDVVNAIDISQSADFVNEMDGTYDARIAQGGTNVSDGQKQRLTIARAIARKPEMLIFDDSFSALDYKTDKALRTALDEKQKDVTKIIVGQRIGTIRHADQIVVLDHGEAVGIGTHDELMQNCPVYQEIANSQLSKEELANA